MCSTFFSFPKITGFSNFFFFFIVYFKSKAWCILLAECPLALLSQNSFACSLTPKIWYLAHALPVLRALKSKGKSHQSVCNDVHLSISSTLHPCKISLKRRDLLLNCMLMMSVLSSLLIWCFLGFVLRAPAPISLAPHWRQRLRRKSLKVFCFPSIVSVIDYYLWSHSFPFYYLVKSCMCNVFHEYKVNWRKLAFNVHLHSCVSCVRRNVVAPSFFCCMFFFSLPTKAFVCLQQMLQDFKKSLLVCPFAVPCNT